MSFAKRFHSFIDSSSTRLPPCISLTRRSGDLEEISKEDSEDESFLQVCSVRRPHLLTMIVSIVEKSVEEPDDDVDDHGDIVVGDDRDDRDGDESFLLSGIFFLQLL